MNGRLLGDEGKELAHKALELMAQHNLPPTPENYSVWISYACDSNAELCQAINDQIDTGNGFTDEISNELFERYFQWKAVQDALLESGDVITRELGAVREHLQAAERDNANFGETLADATSGLSDPTNPAGVKEMVENLVSATAKMQQRSQDLESKLQATSKEVTQLRSNLEKVREEAMTDALTGVANRKRFDESLRKARKASETSGEAFSLILCDIDFFKRFNDTWGHQTGDQIIRFVAGCMTRHAKEGHIVARYGGEEFGIVMPNTTAEEAEKTAEKIRQTVASKKLLRKSTQEDLGNITISLGVAEYQMGEPVEALIERSDTYLYKSKTNGRNRTTSEPNQLDKNAA